MKALFASILLASAAMAAPQQPADDAAPPSLPRRTTPWPAEVLRAAESLPIQDNGRVKPLSTFAAFELLKINGKRSTTTASGESLSPTAWLLDLTFFPAQAFDHPCILIEDYDVVDDLGLSHEGKHKRDRYSLRELMPAHDKLADCYQRFAKVDPKLLTAIQGQEKRLAENFFQLNMLLAAGEFARLRFDLEGDYAGAERFFPGLRSVGIVDVLRAAPKLHDEIAAVLTTRETASLDELPADFAALREILMVVDDRHVRWNALAIVPPPIGEDLWLSPATLVDRVLKGGRIDDLGPQIDLLDRFAALAPQEGGAFDMASFQAGIATLHTGAQTLADARGEYSKIPLEVSFYKADYFFYARWLFCLSFLVCAIGLMLPGQRWLARLPWVTTIIPLGMVITGITLRCIIRSRPPVSTLYETILFITAVGVTASLVTEAITRQRVAQFLGAFIGAAGLFLASWYEEVEKGDTMPVLQAVLDTNFWLSTHVTCVTIGYAAGLVAALIGHVYIFGKLFGVRRNEPAFYRSVARMVYGTVCFGLLFSTVGTILGGIWANESWGRFWGWDPKENGALLIVLMNLIILHSRLGGFLRDFGTCMAAVCLGIVVCFSWFHTNLLSVGLHAYGFNKETHNLVMSMYGFELGVLVLGAVAHKLDARRRAAAPAMAQPKPMPFRDRPAQGRV